MHLTGGRKGLILMWWPWNEENPDDFQTCLALITVIYSIYCTCLPGIQPPRGLRPSLISSQAGSGNELRLWIFPLNKVAHSTQTAMTPAQLTR